MSENASIEKQRKDQWLLGAAAETGITSTGAMSDLVRVIEMF